MPWPPNPYAIVLWAIAATFGALAAVAWGLRARTRGARSFAFFTLAGAVWALAEGMQVAVADPAVQLTWLQLQMLGIATVPVGLLVFANDYTRQTAWLNRFVVALLLVIPAITVALAWTYPLQDVLWRGIAVADGRLLVTRGPWFWVHTATSYLWLALASFYLLRGYVGTPRGYRQQLVWVLVAVLVPWLTNVVVLFGGWDLPLDLTPLSFGVSAVVFAFVLFSHRLLDIVPVARETVMRNLGDPVLVLDPRQRVLQANPAAATLLGADDTDALVGQAATKLFEDQPSLRRALGGDETLERDLTWTRGPSERYLRAQVTPLHDRRGRRTGDLVRLQDIGRQVLAERTLSEAERRLREQLAYVRALQDVTNGLAERRPVGEMLEAVLRRAAEALGTMNGFVNLVAAGGAVLERHRAVGRFAAMPDLLFRSGEGLAGRAWREAKPVSVPDYADWSGKLRGVDLSWARAAIAVPMLGREGVLGVLALARQRDDRRPFSEAEQGLLVSFARLGAIALDNVRLIEEIDARRRESEQLARIGTAMQEPTSLQERVDLSLQAIQEVVGFERAVVWLPVRNGRALRATSWIGFAGAAAAAPGADTVPLDGSVPLLEVVYRLGEEQVLDQTGAVPDRWRALGPVAVSPLLRSRAPAVLPLVSRGRTVGVLAVDNAYSHKPLADKLPVLRRFATSVAVAIDSARLYQDVQHELVERRAAEAQLRLSEEGLREAKEAAEAANASKSAFLANVSHELRTPLTSILGFARLIERRFEEVLGPELADHPDRKVKRAVDQVRTNAGIIYHESQRLTHLINEVLDLAKIEAGRVDWRMAPLVLADVVRRAAIATQGLIELKPQVRLEVDAPDGLPIVTGDRDRLTQVVINLISNAVKFTPNGAVTVALRAETDRQVGDALVVRVRDTGIGIAPEDHDAVFEQFKQVGDTLTDKPQGTGLGLPICKQIVEHHGGRMWVDSALGEGATFAFAIPREATGEGAAEAAGAPAVAAAEEGLRRFVGSTVQAAEEALRRRVEALVRRTLSGAEAAGAAGTRVLVVDDDAQIRALLRQELEEAGHTVVEAADGREALAAVAAHRPDLVVLDVMMPELSGFDVAAVLKGDPATARVPIVILSVVQDEERGAKLGVARYFTKPVDVRALTEEVAVVLRDAAADARLVVVDPQDAAPEDRQHALRVRDALREGGFAVDRVERPEDALRERASDASGRDRRALPDLVLAAADVARRSDLAAAARSVGVAVVLFQ